LIEIAFLFNVLIEFSNHVLIFYACEYFWNQKSWKKVRPFLLVSDKLFISIQLFHPFFFDFSNFKFSAYIYSHLNNYIYHYILNRICDSFMSKHTCFYDIFLSEKKIPKQETNEKWKRAEWKIIHFLLHQMHLQINFH